MTCQLLVLALIAAGLGGCSFWGDDAEECVSVQEYQDATAGANLSVPAGLDRPDPSGRLNVPETPLPAEPLSKNAACLQRPPSYFDKPLAAPAAPAN